MDEQELMKKFEEETGKNAIWRGKPTKGYKEWKKNPEAFRRIQIECPFCKSIDLAVKYGGRIPYLSHIRGYKYIGCDLDLIPIGGSWYCNSCNKGFHYAAYPNAYCVSCKAFLKRAHIKIEFTKNEGEIKEIKFCKNCGNKLSPPFNPE